MPFRKSREQFIEDAKRVHGSKYDYSIVEYINDSTRVWIICPQHGKFFQYPTNHLRGVNCPQCARRSASRTKTKNTSYFKSKATKLWRKRYDYSHVNYVDCHTHVEIICPYHGSFWKAPLHHLSGQGCPVCGRAEGARKRFNNDNDPNRLSTLYLVSIQTFSELFLKIGITRQSITERFRKWHDATVTPIHSIIFSAPKIAAAEQQILKLFFHRKYTPHTIPDGHTECFVLESLLDLCEFIDDMFPIYSTSGSGHQSGIQ